MMGKNLLKVFYQLLMILKEQLKWIQHLLKTLEKFEVKAIDCEGQEFDPYKMEAVLKESIIEEEPNIVLAVLQKGYTYKDKVIRPAMVKVNE